MTLKNAKVLELFGNAGQLLADPEVVVKQENYTVFWIILQEAIQQGIEDYRCRFFRLWITTIK